MHQLHPIYTDKSMQSYFETLPPTVQEAVFQSGVKIETLQQLKDFATAYNKK